MFDEIRVLRAAIQNYRAAVTADGVPWPEPGAPQDAQPHDLDLIHRVFDIDHLPEQLSWFRIEGWDPWRRQRAGPSLAALLDAWTDGIAGGVVYRRDSDDWLMAGEPTETARPFEVLRGRARRQPPEEAVVTLEGQSSTVNSGHCSRHRAALLS